MASGCLTPPQHHPQLFTLYLPRDAELVAAFWVPYAVDSEQIWGHPHLSLNTKYANHEMHDLQPSDQNSLNTSFLTGGEINTHLAGLS